MSSPVTDLKGRSSGPFFSASLLACLGFLSYSSPSDKSKSSPSLPSLSYFALSSFWDFFDAVNCLRESAVCSERQNLVHAEAAYSMNT